MFAPITGSLILENYPLQGASQQVQFSFPDWFDFSSSQSVISGLVNTLGENINLVNNDVSRLLFSTVPGQGYLSEPRIAFLSNLTEELKDNTYSLFFSVSGSWVPLYQASSVKELYFSDGPVFYKEDSQIIFRNLDKELSFLTGSVTTNGYDFTISGFNKDVEILTSSNAFLPSKKWLRHEPEEFINLNKISLTTSGSYFWISKTNNFKPFDIKIVKTDKELLVKAYPVQLQNNWDKQSSYVNLVRRRNESNLSLKNRILSRIRNQNKKGKSKISFDLALDLNRADFYEWDGVSVFTLPKTYGLILISHLTRKEWATEYLESFEKDSTTFFTSSKNHFKGFYYLNGKIATLASNTNGVLGFNNNYTSKSNQGITTGQLFYHNWIVSGSQILPTKNLQKGKYYITAINDINVKNLSGPEARALMYDNQFLTTYGKTINDYQNKIASNLYGNARWGKNRFFDSQKEAALPDLVAFNFED